MSIEIDITALHPILCIVRTTQKTDLYIPFSSLFCHTLSELLRSEMNKPDEVNEEEVGVKPKNEENDVTFFEHTLKKGPIVDHIDAICIACVDKLKTLLSDPSFSQKRISDFNQRLNSIKTEMQMLSEDMFSLEPDNFSNITWEIIKTNPYEPWSWEGISQNPTIQEKP